ncbi:serine/threonine-protein kinase [Streptomyces sp. NRRL F-5126]|uniref:serine/threonine-protein kinase n=1 Tax=Streptomyces sp. NRRL F-5126 TaxID=1463857 RepID=UPI00068E86F9|nr:serine/threonine-protein kinase [Streptomyces sp. NRRL F-5126]
MSEAEQPRNAAQDPQRDEPQREVAERPEADGEAAGSQQSEKPGKPGKPQKPEEAAKEEAEPEAAARDGAAEGGRASRLLAGRYRLQDVLGRGGMGTVWRALDEMLGRTVAVKELRFPGAIDDDEKRRLITRTLREAKAIARIRNNGAVTVFDVVDEDDRPWIVMELIEGKSLAEVIREDGTLTPRRAAEVGLAVLDVLRQAHRQGILHRDVKPSNVLIAEEGRVVLTDFGIAQVEGDPSVTSTGMLVGAPSYISPERARGHKPGPAADLWSLGGLLYAAVEGTPPYDKGSAIATLTAVMTEAVDRPVHAGPLEEVIYGLLAKDPDKRLDDARTRAMLMRVVNAPDAPEKRQEPADLDATRAVPLAALPEAPAAPTDGSRASGPARRPAAGPSAKPFAKPFAGRFTKPAGTGRRAAEPARPAATAAMASLAAAPGRAAPRAGAAGRPAAPRAPLTDVVSRKTLVIIAVVVALAVLGVVLALSLGGGNGDTSAKGRDGAKPAPSSSASATAGSTGAAPQGHRTRSSAPSGSSSASGASHDAARHSGGSGLPAGYAAVSDKQFKFSMAMPKGFHRTGTAGQSSGGIFSASGGFPRIQVDFTDSPTKDAVLAWTQLEPAVSGSSSGYKLIGIKKADYKGYPTVADWQFERKQSGQRVKVLDRGFRIDSRHGYSIMISCKADAWDGKECSTLRQTAFDTFKPSK